MVYNKKLCAPIKGQKSTILGKTKILELAYLVGNAPLKQWILIALPCFKEIKLGKVVQT